MNFFEVLYSDCFGNRHRTLVATIHETPETPTSEFNFSWNGNSLINYIKTTFENYRTNHFKSF